MHDPMVVAHEIRYPWRKYSRSEIEERAKARGVMTDHPSLDFERNYRDSFVTIWHNDPETDGTDDSCGWFMRARHGDPVLLEQVRKDFAFEWAHGWFSESGFPNYSVMATAIMMFQRAAHTMFGHDWRKTRDFMQSHIYEILTFAENATDSLHSGITQRYGASKPDERIAEMAQCIFSWILRARRPWYKHPKWHIWHWSIQVPALQHFKRWAFSRCCKCKRGFSWGYSPRTDQWNADGPRWFRSESSVYHSDCSNAGISVDQKEYSGAVERIG